MEKINYNQIKLLFVLIFTFTFVQVRCQPQNDKLFIESQQTIGNFSSFSVFLYDIDGDSDLDAFTQNWHPKETQKNNLWINNGKSEFTLDKKYFTETAPQGIIDLNSDKLSDAIINNSIYINQTNNNYKEGSKLIDSYIGDIRFGDINNDGIMDILVNANYVFLNINENIKNVFELGGGLADKADFIDVDNDGDLDIFVAHNHNAPPPPFKPVDDKIWINNGNGDFTKSDQVFEKDYSTNLAIGDLNNDGFDDVVVTGGKKTVRVYINDKKGHFVEKLQKIDSFSSMAVKLADMDNDGDLDAFIANGKPMGPGEPNLVLLNDGSGLLIDSGLRLGNEMSNDVALGDLDNDKDIDAFVVNVNLTDGGAGNKVYINTLND